MKYDSRMHASAELSQVELSIVAPLFNESANVGPLVERIVAAVAPLGLCYEIVLVDDGSRDATAGLIEELGQRDARVRLVRLSRNFGHQAALFAGMEHARGDAVVTLDGDLQHPPELIPEMVRLWRDGAEVVQAVRRAPADEQALKRAASRGFYRLLSAVAHIQVTPGAADFRLMAREALDAFRACRERCRFNRGLVKWVGFEQVELVYDAALRERGDSKYSWRAMLRLAGDAIFSFSSWPLRVAGLAGVIVSAAAAVYLLYVVIVRLFTNYAVPGWGSILATLLIIGGVQLMVLWILGEYIGRLYEEVKQRPLYIVRTGRREVAREPDGTRSNVLRASSMLSGDAGED